MINSEPAPGEDELDELLQIQKEKNLFWQRRR